MKHPPLIKRSIRNAERQGAVLYAGDTFAVARVPEGTLDIRLKSERLSAILLLISLLLVGITGGGCRAKQDRSATITKSNAETNRPCWVPSGYTVPSGKTVIGPIQAQDDCKFGDFVDVLVAGSDPAAKVSSTYVTVTNLMVVAGSDAPKDCLPVGTVAIECSREQAELMQSHGSPANNWARLHPRAGGNAQDEVRKTTPPRGIEIFRGTKQETVYFSASNGVSVPPRQEEGK